MAGLPIVAIATPAGEGAIAILRLSGSGCLAVVDGIFQARQRLADLPPRTVVRGKILGSDGLVLDDVLAVAYVAPRSYTGEEMVEIFCHGGSLVTGMILQRLLEVGARLAEPGEFTQRAFLNGKLDLTQAEAVMDLITAKTPLAVRAAHEQMQGRLGEETRQIAEELLDVLAHLEAWIDFPEEDLSLDTEQGFAQEIEGLIQRIERLLATAEEGRILREGVKLAIVGRPNAGKSSLLNRLLGFERAIVSELPGTTRDTIEEFINLRGVPFRVVDTAGLRETDDALECAGIARTRRALEEADIILEVLDVSEEKPLSELPPGRSHLRVWNKADLLPAEELGNRLAVSCRTGAGMTELVNHLVESAGHRLPAGNQSLLAINARHQACLHTARESLLAARKGVEAAAAPELVAVDLRAAAEALGEITGHCDTEDLLGRIFSRFCIGK